MKKTIIIPQNEPKKKVCFECGKNLGLFKGYRHPTLGIKHLICRECYEKVELSVERWGRCVLWNSFNPDAPDPTFSDTYPFPKKHEMMNHKKEKHQG
jgi:ribosomal protein L40E